jgi:chemotaxis protein MotA
MEINHKNINVIIAILAGVMAWIVLMVIAIPLPDSSAFHRYVIALGGSGSGFIQAICYGLFTYAILELREKRKDLDSETEAFNLELLPEKEQLVLSPEEVGMIKLSMLDLERKGIQFRVVNFIKKTCTQYRNENSTTDTYNVLSSQIKTSKDEMEGDLEMTRYIVQALPMIGFIGTVIGLTEGIVHSKGMLEINPAIKQDALIQVVDSFSMAFGTTFLALILSLLLTRSYHIYLGKMDLFFSKTENYIIDNLISRIYKQ